MERLVLKSPNIEYSHDIMLFRTELLDANDIDSFAGCDTLENCNTAEEWFDILAKHEKEKTCPDGRVPSSTYIAVRVCDNKIVGIVDLRHHINTPVLSTWGGHMGYTVRPSERGKGYAKEILRLNLENCKTKGISKVLVTCNTNNIASEKTIVANGGLFENEISVGRETIKRYWFNL